MRQMVVQNFNVHLYFKKYLLSNSCNESFLSPVWRKKIEISNEVSLNHNQKEILWLQQWNVSTIIIRWLISS